MSKAEKESIQYGDEHHRSGHREKDQAADKRSGQTDREKIERRRGSRQHRHDEVNKNQCKTYWQGDGEPRAEQRTAKEDQTVNRIVRKHRAARGHGFIAFDDESNEHQMPIHGEQQEGRKNRQESADYRDRLPALRIGDRKSTRLNSSH